MIDEIEEAGVGIMEVLEDQHDRGARRQALEERPPGCEELLRAARRGLDAEQGEQGRLDHPLLGRVRHVLGDRCLDLRPGDRLVVGLEQPGPPADDLAEGPEADPVAVGGGAAVVEPDLLDQAVEVLEELPGEPGLADPGRADHRHEAGPLLAARGVEQILEEAQLVLATDERRLERLGPVPPATLGDDRGRPPRLDRGLLALEDLLARLLEDDRPAGGPMGRLADEDGARGGDRLEPAGGVHQVAGNHALVRRADRDRGFAGEDAGPRLDRRIRGP